MYDILELVKSRNGFEKFNQMQEKAINSGVLEHSAIVSSPTASGKTVVAELIALNSILNKRKKAIYTCPLRALAAEHARDFKKKYVDLKIRPVLSTGDYDSSGQNLAYKDMIFTTYEKLDSLLNHEAEWLSKIGALIIDEIHLIGSNRGPVLESLIAKMRLMNTQMQILGLSATIPNFKEIALWLNAKPIFSNYRPVELKEGVYLDGNIHFKESTEKIKTEQDPETSLAIDTLNKQKQAIFFLNTRKRSESCAERLSKISEKFLTQKEKAVLEKASGLVLNALEQPTKQCKKLSELIKKGSCFHNAGLVQKQRHIIEQLFRKNYLKFISSTPTLSTGVNLPAFRVIMPSPYRYDENGYVMIPVYEWKQVAGRAGRPKYDNAGEAILIAKNEQQKADYFQNLVLGEIEKINSNLNNKNELAFHLLNAISSGFIRDMESMEEFFSMTFFASQNNGLSGIARIIMAILKDLDEMEFIRIDETKIEATPIGKRVSELYLYPYSGYEMINMLKTKKTSLFAHLFIIVSMEEFGPRPRPKKEDLLYLQSLEEDFPLENFQEESLIDEEFAYKLNATRMLLDWVEEVKEENIVEAYKIQPGTLRLKLETADWLCYSAIELSKTLGLEEHLLKLAVLRKRLASGIKEELIQLCELKGIGRFRARRLYNAGLTSLSALRKVDIKDLEKVIGKTMAESIKTQLAPR